MSHTSSNYVPEQQWAQVLNHVRGPLGYQQKPVSQPGPDEVLIHIKFAGVCHTDLHAINGDWPLRIKLPLVGGHEGAGIVVKIGEQVRTINVGGHVGMRWIHSSCQNCTYCIAGDEMLCDQVQLSGYSVDGTFQQYAIAKAAYVVRIQKEVKLEEFAPVLCTGPSAYKGIKESGVRPGETLAVIGAGGGIGSMVLQYAKAMGVHTIAIDKGHEKGLSTLSLGAKVYIDVEKNEAVVREAKAATLDGKGPHAVLLLATSELLFAQAIEYVRPKGTIVFIALPTTAKFSAPVFDVVTKMIIVKGCYGCNLMETRAALEMYLGGDIRCLYSVRKMSELRDVYEEMKNGRVVGRVVLDTGK